MIYKEFIFESYNFNSSSGDLDLHYSFDGQLRFNERFTFPISDKSYDSNVLEHALFYLFIMAGVSYYKAHQVEGIKINTNSLSIVEAEFFNNTFSNGLGEYYFINDLDPNVDIGFRAGNPVKLEQPNIEQGLLVGIGGGKDSLVTIEALKNTALDISSWSLNHREQLEPLVNKIGIKHYFVDRHIDPLLLSENEKGALNGHVPISAILACVGLVLCILNGKTDSVVSNEQTANEPNLEYKGKLINHQYSKSQIFEREFGEIIRTSFGPSYKYYSFLRPLTEVRIAEIFSKNYLDKYIKQFSSCNRAFILSSSKMTWCGECPKCAFIFLALTPFTDRLKLESIFSGENLLLKSSLYNTYKEMLGISGHKPLDCVGEIKESRTAMHLALDKYPELIGKYIFDIPEGYDYKAIYADEMPIGIKQIFSKYIETI